MVLLRAGGALLRRSILPRSGCVHPPTNMPRRGRAGDRCRDVGPRLDRALPRPEAPGAATCGQRSVDSASAITAAVGAGASSGRRNTAPGIVTKVTLSADSSVARSASVSPPSPPSST